MGDSTPDAKASSNLTSKYLTPCRTFGLKRRSTPNLVKREKKVKSENDMPMLKSSIESPVTRKINNCRSYLNPLNSISDKLENHSTLDRYGNSSSKDVSNNAEGHLVPCTSGKSLKTESIEHHSTPNKYKYLPLPSDLGSSYIEAQLVALIKRINDKYGRLEKLKQEQIYIRKHNMLELQKNTKKWMAGFKEVVVALHSELEARGKVCSLLDLLEEHHIPLDRVGFSVDNMEFD
ncbi:uncharacterized protein isoform X2 [Rhodnius prolixus]|uniref:Uncharacterized protein n=3 Tax=Rhodnius TaxID=13248 RepID=T1HIS8_RHOPR